MTRLDNEPDYFFWLCEMVCVDGRYTDESYWTLAKALWDTEYYWLIDQDENRAKSVSMLRHRYLSEGGKEWYDEPPSVFEVLVMLSDAMFDLLDELEGEDERVIYFWEMINNLGLGAFTDATFDEFPKRNEWFHRRIHQRVITWLDRQFEYDGTLSPFPLRNPREDQRNVELWYQMQAYIIENY